MLDNRNNEKIDKYGETNLYSVLEYQIYITNEYILNIKRSKETYISAHLKWLKSYALIEDSKTTNRISKIKSPIDQSAKSNFWPKIKKAD